MKLAFHEGQKSTPKWETFSGVGQSVVAKALPEFTGLATSRKECYRNDEI